MLLISISPFATFLLAPPFHGFPPHIPVPVPHCLSSFRNAYNSSLFLLSGLVPPPLPYKPTPFLPPFSSHRRVCLATSVPLVDAGSTGFLAQAMPILTGKTACYECVPKVAAKVYPICTIRSTPGQYIHIYAFIWFFAVVFSVWFCGGFYVL